MVVSRRKALLKRVYLLAKLSAGTDYELVLAHVG